MKFTAGILNLSAVLMIIHLYPVIARPACNPESQAKLGKKLISGILNTYVEENGKDVEPLNKNFSQLDIQDQSGTINEKKLDAVCGVNYTIYALESIYDHQKQWLNPMKKNFLQKLDEAVRKLEGTLKPCLDFLNVSCHKHAKPEFPEHSDHYKRKQWSLAALQQIEKFLEKLGQSNFLQDKTLHSE